MQDPTPTPSEQDDDAKTDASQNPKDLEEAQKDAAEEREEEGGYQ